MKKVIKQSTTLNRTVIAQMIKQNWWRSIYEGKFCMENSKTIFIVPKLPFKVVIFQSKANDLRL